MLITHFVGTRLVSAFHSSITAVFRAEAAGLIEESPVAFAAFCLLRRRAALRRLVRETECFGHGEENLPDRDVPRPVVDPGARLFEGDHPPDILPLGDVASAEEDDRVCRPVISASAITWVNR